MPIEFQCHGCHKLLRVSDSAAGKRARCPECGTINPVPGAPDAAAGEEPADVLAENPYASPAGVHRFDSPERRVSGPAAALVVFGMLGALQAALALAARGFGLLAGLVPQNAGILPIVWPAGVEIAVAVAALVRSVLLVFGGLQMRNLQSYGLCTAAAILAVIPCFQSCCCLEIPFGIWALVVLNDPEVRSAFGS